MRIEPPGVVQIDDTFYRITYRRSIQHYTASDKPAFIAETVDRFLKGLPGSYVAPYAAWGWTDWAAYIKLEALMKEEFMTEGLAVWRPHD